ncbi:MAG TPA: sugar transferase [Candidatus Paceibacterota bacterium]
MERMAIEQKTIVAKRLFDIVVATLLLMLFSPFCLLIAFLIVLEHALTGRLRDPIFYTETRISQGKPFRIIKFNIFKYKEIQRLRKEGVFIQTKTLEHNGSIKRIGFVLKQIYFDEIPQLFNVIRGDMSIVGPRPLNEKAYQKALRQEVTALLYLKAGLTGNFQCYKDVAGKTMKDLDGEYLARITHDPYYKVLLFDLKILYRTVKFVLRAKGI